MDFPHRTQLTLTLLVITLLIALFSASSGHAQGGLSGRAWIDSNLNGQLDEGEAGLPGVLVEIEDED